MKKIIIILFLAAVSAVNIFSDSNPHDSLLFDGSNLSRTETYYSREGEECEFRVTYVKGNVTGKIKKRHIYEACGIDTVIEYEDGSLQRNTVIKGGEPVITGPESTAKIEISDGSVIVLGPNTKYTLPENVCDLVRKSFLERGSVWSKVKKLIGGGKFEVSGKMMGVGVRGTEFSVEVIEESGIQYEIVKVYEGSVEATLKSIDTKSYEDKNEELTKLYEDFEAGKITIEEFSRRSEEITNELQNETTIINMMQIVEAGYLLKTDGKTLGEPQPFNTSENNWFKINE